MWPYVKKSKRIKAMNTKKRHKRLKTFNLNQQPWPLNPIIYNVSLQTATIELLQMFVRLQRNIESAFLNETVKLVFKIILISVHERHLHWRLKIKVSHKWHTALFLCLVKGHFTKKGNQRFDRTYIIRFWHFKHLKG